MMRRPVDAEGFAVENEAESAMWRAAARDDARRAILADNAKVAVGWTAAPWADIDSMLDSLPDPDEVVGAMDDAELRTHLDPREFFADDTGAHGLSVAERNRR